MPQIVLHLILLSNHKKSKKERRITEIFLQRIPFSLKNYFCLGGAYDGADFQKPQSKLTRCVLVSVLALSVIASRCHLSQSERPWQSAKFPVLYFTPCCRKGSRQALRSDFTPLPRAPLLGELSNEVRLRGCRKDNLYHLNPHFLKYRIRFPACQRAGFRLRWAARCHAWMAVYWGTR